MNFITKNPIFIINLIFSSVSIIAWAIGMGGYVPWLIDFIKQDKDPLRKQNNNTRNYILIGVGAGLMLYTLILWAIVKLILITIKNSMK